MLLLVGLGNPKVEYALNRHNVGFMVVDAIQQRHDFSLWFNRFQAQCAEGMLAGKKCFLLKPRTFMNESGRAVGEALRFYKLSPDNLIVVHDEIDLEPGKVRIKNGGGHAGHNGLRSISTHVGNNYRRIRIGIGHPGNKNLVCQHVLSNFNTKEACWLEPLLNIIADSVVDLASNQEAAFMNRLDPAYEQATEKTPKKISNTSETNNGV